MKSFKTSGPQRIYVDEAYRIRRFSKPLAQKTKLRHDGKWIIVRDRYYEAKKWLIELTEDQSVAFIAGTWLSRTRYVNPKLLYDALRIICEEDPVNTIDVPDFLIFHLDYKTFLKGFREMQKLTNIVII